MESPDTSSASAIAAIVGAENVGPGTPAFVVSGQAPPLAAAPGTREEAAALISLARERGWSLVCFGGGTQMEMGLPPRKLDLVLSTRRLHRVVDYQPDDMTITLEPGVTLAALERVLAGRGQFLPLDPPLPERATIGGTMAAAASGPWRAGYGAPRDWVIGCRVLGADAREVRGGGQVVKNVAGYDLPKLYTGSYGTLGLLTEVTLKVMPRPPAAGRALISLSSPAAVEALLARVLDSDLQPACVELAHEVGTDVWGLYLEFFHVSEAVEWQLGALKTIAAPHRLERLTDDTYYVRRHRDGPAQHPLQARIGTTSARVTEAAGRLAELCAARSAAGIIRAHAATGQVLLGAGDHVDEGFATAIRETAAASGASCVFPRLPQGLLGKVDPWSSPGEGFRLMQGIKQALDPTGIFSPGRFAGGL